MQNSRVETKVCAQPPRRRASVIVWMPLIGLVVAGLLAAAGVGVTDNAAAASSDVLIVEATVEAYLEIDMTDCPDPLTWANDLTAGAGVEETSTACEVAFRTTNNAAGANLQIRNARNTQAHFFCQDEDNPTALDCAANEFYANLAVSPSSDAAFGADTGKVAMRVHSPNNATADWNTAGNRWYNVPAYAAASTACHTTSAGATWGECDIAVGANTSSSILTGAYEGELEFIVTQR